MTRRQASDATSWRWELALVNRVYLTRSIDQTRRLTSSQAATLQSVKEVLTGMNKSDVDPASPPSQKQTEDPLEQLKKLDATLFGGLLSMTSGSDSQFELKQTFQRPIVIGYRAVRRTFDYDLDRQNLAPGQGGNFTMRLALRAAVLSLVARLLFPGNGSGAGGAFQWCP